MQENSLFLISLKKDDARRETLKNRFASYDKFNIIDAIDGRVMSAKEYFGYALRSFKAYNRLLSPGEIGCSLSHMSAYEEFLNSGAKFALIFEDDVIGDDEGIKNAFELADKIDKNSILICGCQDGLEGRFSAFGKRLEDDFYLVSKHSYVSIYRAAAYIVTRDSAKALLETHKRAICTADLWSYLLTSNKLNMYFSDIFAHPIDLSDSNINAERDERGYAKINLKALFKSFKYILATRYEAKFKGYERIFKEKT
ncbi:glycosyltransferase family 25 protein [Campylobacter sp. RM16192]|uniref:glycosyltransferase family 25 protein n=1 Tax=Campylobacter sp. RM16192 TaxID=1660080 RepID=UPI001451F912|nr:glycosyltransferase family 25 protein [Campylobacter sp. RM16192]QCD52081.1 glycosyltransferase, family 25 [Campylobacter sp. RM16192]